MCEYFIKMENRLKNHPYLNSIRDFILGFEDEMLRKYLSFLYLYMPYADVANVSKEVILDYALAGVNLRKGRCSELDEDIFLNYVLFHRIGSEKIVANRTYFYDLVKDLLGESEKENVIKLNYFCGKNVTYRSTDTRTLDPLTVYNSGFGRCGEESIFAVSVFRAAGIPARQIYVPLWAHCDDNHAWVEVYVDNEWHYLGACEPEEILDKGWFDDASARAMIVKSILYGNIGEEAKNCLGYTGGLYEINQTKRYAATKHVKIYLYDCDKILSNFNFNICLMNFAMFSPIVKARTDMSGAYEADIGIGKVFLSLYRGKNYIIPLDIEEKDTFYIDIADFEPEYNKYNEVFINVPKASTRNRKKAPKKEDIGHQVKDFPNEEVRKKTLSEGMGSLWDILSDKDKRDISLEIIKDCYKAKNTYSVSDDIYLNYIQNPRVDFEHLEVCRELFKDKFTDINSILDFVKNIKLTKERTITGSYGVYKTRISNVLSVKIFVINALRGMGIPAKLVDKDVYLYDGKSFKIFDKLLNILDGLEYICCAIENINGGVVRSYNREDANEHGMANLSVKGELGGFGESFSLSKFDLFENNLISLDKSSIKKNMILPACEYVLSTQNRLPNGNICAKYNILKLEAGSRNEVKLEYMQANPADMLSHYTLPKELQDILGIYDTNHDISLIIWMNEEEEPSQHVANDLLLKDDLLRNMKLRLLFTNEFERKDFVISKLVDKSQNKSIYTNLGEAQQEAFGRSIFVNYETLPIVALCKGSSVVYAFSGYQAGSGNLIENIRNLIKEQHE